MSQTNVKLIALVFLLSIIVYVVTNSSAGSEGSLSEQNLRTSDTDVSRIIKQNQANKVSSNTVGENDINKWLNMALNHPRRRKMNDLTKDPSNNDMQVLVNSWIEGSFSPIHMHRDYDEVFVPLSGALAFFSFDSDGKIPTCHILSPESLNLSDGQQTTRLIVISKGDYHAMTAAPSSLGYDGKAVVMETSAHKYNPRIQTKYLSSHWHTTNNEQDGIKKDYEHLLKVCPYKI